MEGQACIVEFWGCRSDLSSNSFHIYPLNHLGKKVNSYIVALMIDSRYRFWVCTSAGLYLFDHQTGHFELFSLREALKEDAEPWVTAICEDKQRNIWIGTRYLPRQECLILTLPEASLW